MTANDERRAPLPPPRPSPPAPVDSALSATPPPPPPPPPLATDPMSLPQVRWEHAMSTAVDQSDVLSVVTADLELVDPGHPTGIVERSVYVDRSTAVPLHRAPAAVPRRSRGILRRTAAVIVVVGLLVAVAVGLRLVIVRVLADDDAALAPTASIQRS